MTKTIIQEVEVEYIDDKGLKGILIIDRSEGFFLPTTKQDIEDWAKETGEEGTDYTVEKEWFDDYPYGGHYYNNKVLVEDAWGDQLRDYAFAHKKLWVQSEDQLFTN